MVSKQPRLSSFQLPVISSRDGRLLCCRGDGTLLNVMDDAVRHDVPVAGIRHGQLGFLATFSPEDIEQDAFDLSGDFELAGSMLRYRDKSGFSKCALNDLV